jgi:predicted GNAT family acetyltransferase
MLTPKAIRRLNDAMHVMHHFGSLSMAFNYGPLGMRPEALAAYLRVVADGVEKGMEVDLNHAVESMSFFYTNTDDQVCSLILAHYDEKTSAMTIHFAWTHPAMRRLALFTKLMEEVVRCHWESASIQHLRVSPPVQNDHFDAAVSKLGFKPISLTSEYRPHQ